MSIERGHITVSGLRVKIVRKDIKNLHLGVYPPNGRVRVAAPLRVSDNAVRLAVITRLGWIKRQRAGFQSQDPVKLVGRYILNDIFCLFKHNVVKHWHIERIIFR